MRIVLATGIYPPDLGGPATYVQNLAKALSAQGHQVTVITYADRSSAGMDESWAVVRVGKSLPIFRWFAYASALRKCAADADIVYAFSSVSVGVPLLIAQLKKPKRVLRLGGDFLWERYTDWGGRRTLKEWHESSWFLVLGSWYRMLIGHFDHLVFSTAFQQSIYERHYRHLPAHVVIENAQPVGSPVLHQMHKSLRLLFVGRFVGFKNLPSLVTAMKDLHDCALTIVGDGPLAGALRRQISAAGLADRVSVLPPARGAQKEALFADHDVLVLPSLTELSPNVALEAVATGLPVLLSRETGLSPALTAGMRLAVMRAPDDIVRAVRSVICDYAVIAAEAIASHSPRTWDTLAHEHLSLFQTIL